MKLKAAAKISIICLSLSILSNLTYDVRLHQLLISGIFDDSRTVFRIATAVQLLLFHLPLLIFFIVLYRQQSIDGLK
jgi:hypothetical protein